MKTTILAQKLALEFCTNPRSGFEFSEKREEVAQEIARFLSASADTEDRVAAIEIALKTNSRKGGLKDITRRAQVVLDWKLPEPVIVKRGRGRPRKIR